MRPQPAPVAYRAWAHPPGWKPRRRPHSAGSWPQAAFLLATLARPQPGEALRFGACALLPSLLAGQRAVDVRLFHADECTIGEIEALALEAAARGLAPPLSRRELVQLMMRRCYRQRLPLVGYRLPAQLGRLAAGWGAAKDGGFSLIFATRPAPLRRTVAERRRRPILQNGEVENGDQPRILVRPLDGQRAEIRFSARGRSESQDRAPDGEGGRPREHYTYPGRFVDLAVLATVQTAGKTHATAAAAATALDTATDNPNQHSSEAPPLAGELDALLAELDILARLYLRLLECHRQTPGGDRISLDQVYSIASYADALLDAIGLELPLSHSDIPDRALAQGMAAFFGGDCGVSLRHQDVPVVYLDITGHYPVSAHLAGIFELLQATKLELVREDPVAIEQLLCRLTAEQLLEDPTLWRDLARTVCLLEPDGDVLPHRVPHGKTLLLKIAPLHSGQFLPYLAADLVASRLRGGPPARISAAFSIRTIPRRRKRLRRLALPSGHTFEPKTDDLFLTLAEERLRLQNDHSLAPTERRRRADVLKLIVNAACYGLLCQINVQSACGEVELTDLTGEKRTIRVETIEEPGRWSMPILAAGVTATGRLLLQLARTRVEQAGGTVCNWDTDSLCIAATATGIPITSPGDPPDSRQVTAEVPLLSYAAITRIQEEFDRISPYRNPSRDSRSSTFHLLALEPENHHPATGRRVELHLYATASKNYDLFIFAPGPIPAIAPAKTSEHGLGHLRTPGRPHLDERDWITEGRRFLLERALGIPTCQPEWWEEPAISVITLNRPGELARLQALHSTERKLLRPFSRLAVAHPHPLYARGRNSRRRTPVAPFHAGFDTHTARWRDLTTGQPLTLRYRPSQHLSQADLTTSSVGDRERILCETVGTALERNHNRPERKAATPAGQPCSRTTTGVLEPAPTSATRLVAVGKETRNLERAGITEDPAYTLYTDELDDAWKTTYLPTLRRLAPGLIPRGRPSRQQRALLSRRAGELARDALSASKIGELPPTDPEALCHLYLRTLRHRLCACGCGQSVTERARYVDGAHRTRAYRRRTEAK